MDNRLLRGNGCRITKRWTEAGNGVWFVFAGMLLRAHGDVGMDLGGGDVFMAQKRLNYSQIGSAFKMVGCERMPHRVTGHAFHHDSQKIRKFGEVLTLEGRFPILSEGKNERVVN